MCVATVCVLAFRGVQIPPELNTLTGGLVGSLASMLVKTSPTETQKTEPANSETTITQTTETITKPKSTLSTDEPTQVVVINKPDDPVPTTEAPQT